MNEEAESYLNLREDRLIFSIWTKPKLTFDYIFKVCPEKNVILFMVLGGICGALDRAATKGMGDQMSLSAVLTIATIAGALFGWISYYLYAFFLSLTGKWIGGKAEPQQFRTVIAWASVPSISSLILLAAELPVFGNDLFRSELSSNERSYLLLYIFFNLIEIALGVWSVVIMIKGTSVVQEFGAGKAILNALLPLFLLIGAMLVIAAIAIVIKNV